MQCRLWPDTSALHHRTTCTFPPLLVQMGYVLLCALWVWRRRTNRRPCCPPMSNPSTSSWTAWPDGSGRWDNWMAAQHLPRDLVRPSSGLQNWLKRWRTICKSCQESNLRCFVTKEQHFLLHVTLWILDTCSTPHFSVHLMRCSGSYNRDTVCVSCAGTARFHRRQRCALKSGEKRNQKTVVVRMIELQEHFLIATRTELFRGRKICIHSRHPGQGISSTSLFELLRTCMDIKDPAPPGAKEAAFTWRLLLLTNASSWLTCNQTLWFHTRCHYQHYWDVPRKSRIGQA